jgi:hypothetical protein
LLPVADTMKFSGAFTAPRRTPRADIRENNRAPGFFSRFSTTQLGGMAIGVTLEYTGADRSLVGHVVMGMAAHSHRAPRLDLRLTGDALPRRARERRARPHRGLDLAAAAPRR